MPSCIAFESFALSAALAVQLWLQTAQLERLFNGFL